MDDIKTWFTSKTVISGALTFLLSIAGALGLKQAVGIDVGSLADTLVSLGTAVLGLITVYGRLTATTKLVAKA